jgi:hypothetical protein
VKRLLVSTLLLTSFFIQLAGATAATTTNCVSAPPGLIAWWRAEGDADDLLRSHPGELKNGTAFAPGIVGQAFRFDGQSAVVQINSRSLLKGQPEVTIEAWVRPLGPHSNEEGYGGQVFAENTSVLNWTRFGLYVLNDGRLIGYGRGTDNGGAVSVTTANRVPLDQWSHVAATWKTGDGMRVYINGALAASMTNALGPFSETDSSYISIGAGGPSAEVPLYRFNGDIDEMGIFTRALSEVDLQAIVSAGSAGKCRPPAPTSGDCVAPLASLIAWWPGDGHANNLLASNAGALINGAGYATGKVGQAFKFDGIDDRVAIAEASAIDISRIPRWTIAAWINPASFTGQTWPTIYSEGRWGISFGLKSTGQLDSWVNNGNEVNSTGSVPLNVWSHVALTYDGVRRTFYINGAAAGTGSAPAVNPDSGGSAIGDVTTSPNSSRFNGLIDEVDLYDQALSEADIRAIFLADSEGKCRSQTNPPPLLEISKSGSNILVSWPAARTNIHIEAATSLQMPILWFPPTNRITVIGQKSVITLQLSTAPAARMFFKLAEGTTAIPGPPNPTVKALVNALAGFSQIDASGSFGDFQGRVGQQIALLQGSLHLFDGMQAAIAAQATNALAVLSPTAVMMSTATSTPFKSFAFLDLVPKINSQNVPGPLTEVINQFKQVGQTVEDLKELKSKLQDGSDLLRLLVENKSLEELVSERSAFFKEISDVFKKMREDLEAPLSDILAGKALGNQEDVDDFNAIVAFMRANDSRLADLMSAAGFTIDSYRKLNLTDRQRDLVAQAFRSSTMRGRLYLRDHLLGFLNTLASAGVQTYADTIFDLTGAGGIKTAAEFAQAVFQFLTQDAPAAQTTLKFNARRRFLRPDDPGSDVTADLFLLGKLPDGKTRLATFVINGKNVINERGDILLTQGFQVPAINYDVLVIPRDQQDQTFKLLPLASAVNANLTTFVDLPLVHASQATLNPQAKQRTANGNLVDATLTWDQLKNLSLRIEGFPQTTDGPMGAVFDTELRPDGTTRVFYIAPFLPPNLPLSLKVSGTNVESATQSITITQPQQQIDLPIVLSAVTNRQAWWPRVVWNLRDYTGRTIASSTGLTFSITLSNSAKIASGVVTNVVGLVSASVSASPIYEKSNPFDVTCKLSLTMQGSAPGGVQLSVGVPNTSGPSILSIEPTELWLKVGFRPLSEGSTAYKADFYGSQRFQNWSNKTFLSADIPGEGFPGNFILMNGYGNISLLNGTVIYYGDIVLGDPNDSYSTARYTLKVTMVTWYAP